MLPLAAWVQVRQMEAEVVAMTAHMLNGGPGTAAPDACGAMTSGETCNQAAQPLLLQQAAPRVSCFRESNKLIMHTLAEWLTWTLCVWLHVLPPGGTESILLAVKASRDYMVAARGITAPEMVVGPSAHAAYWKAAEYFNIKLVIAPLGKDLRWAMPNKGCGRPAARFAATGAAGEVGTGALIHGPSCRVHAKLHHSLCNTAPCARLHNAHLCRHCLGLSLCCVARRLHGSSVARYISSNTVVVVASAPGFPHGVVDDVTGIAAAAAKRGVLCHVDACLGGYLLPFVEQLGYEVPTFDFRVPGEHAAL